MPIVLAGAESYVSAAVAECLTRERGYQLVAAGNLTAGAMKASDGVIPFGDPDAALDPTLVSTVLDAPPPGPVWLPSVERQVFDAADRGVRGVVLRPSIAHGRGGGMVARLASGDLPLAGTGGNLWSFIHVDDLAGLFLLAFESAPSGSFYVAAGGPAVAALLLDRRAGSTSAGREFGWRQSRPTVLEHLAAQGAGA